MFTQTIYDTMLDQLECWIVYDSGAALLIGNVNQAIALEC